jgi:hypothetical protein
VSSRCEIPELDAHSSNRPAGMRRHVVMALHSCSMMATASAHRPTSRRHQPAGRPIANPNSCTNAFPRAAMVSLPDILAGNSASISGSNSPRRSCGGSLPGWRMPFWVPNAPDGWPMQFWRLMVPPRSRAWCVRRRRCRRGWLGSDVDALSDDRLGWAADFAPGDQLNAGAYGHER